MATQYEWVIEQLDGPDSEDVEIVDVNHAPTYAEATAFAAHFTHARIALVRDHDTIYGTERAWAYIEAGTLPEWCEDAMGRQCARVPARYRAQFARGGA